jgi:cobalt-zinc-cadmium efflux system protein
VALDHADDRVGQKRRLRVVFVVVAVFLAVEAVTAFATGSLALLSDAGHMLTDAAGLGMALAAITVASRTARADHRTYGRYRVEMLAATANGVLLLAVAGYAIVEGILRLGEPPAVDTGPMLVVAAVGLAVNLGSWWWLRPSRSGSLNIEGALLEVAADTLGSAAAIAAGLMIRYGVWDRADAAFGIGLGVFIAPRALRLIRRAGRVLMEHAPEDFDVAALSDALRSLPGVSDVHDLHVWTLTSGMDAATVHLEVADGTDLHEALDGAQAVLDGDFGVDHATIQIEPETHRGCAETGW